MSFAWKINQDQACSYESRDAQHEGRGAQLGNIYMLRVSATAPNTLGLGAAALRKEDYVIVLNAAALRPEGLRAAALM